MAELCEILAVFNTGFYTQEDEVCEEVLISDQNGTLAKVKELLASLQSFARHLVTEIPEYNQDELLLAVDHTTQIFYFLVHHKEVYQETIILTALSAAFLFYSVSHMEGFDEAHALDMYLKLMVTTLISDVSFAQDDFLGLRRKFVHDMIVERSLLKNFTFTDIACLFGLLNCSFLTRYLVKYFSGAFLLLNDWIIDLLSSQLSNEYHLFRVLRDYLRLVFENRVLLHDDYSISDSEDEKSFELLLFVNARKALRFIDHRWESPINGIPGFVKECYKSIIQIMFHYSQDHTDHQLYISRELESTLDIPDTSKAKYNKLAILISNLSTSGSSIHIYSPFFAAPVPLYIYLFYDCNGFSYTVFGCLQINSLTHSIVEFYKTSIDCLLEFNFHRDEECISHMWEVIWLDAIRSVYENTILECTIVQNTMIAHVLPYTMKKIPFAFQKLYKALEKYPYGQVSLVKIYLRKKSYESVKNELPGIEWLEEMLQLSEDLVRLEALSLLIEENFVYKNRTRVCEILFNFLRCNMNVDNANFRLKTVSLLEVFYRKIIASLSCRYTKASQLPGMPEDDRKILDFLVDSIDLIFVSLTPGSSFQRKFTALSLFSSMLKVFEKEDKQRAFIFLFKSKKPAYDWHHMMLYGLVDKDETIRKMTAHVLHDFSSSYLAPLCKFEPEFFKQIEDVAHKLLKSPRHQETHIGGLLLKFLFFSSNLREESSKLPGSHFLQAFIKDTNSAFRSDLVQKNPFMASRQNPLHGRFLALNQLLVSCEFLKGIVGKSQLDENELTEIVLGSQMREQIFGPLIGLTFDSIDHFLAMLTPKTVPNNSNGSEVSNNSDEFAEDDYNQSAPSFTEIGETIVELIRPNFSENMPTLEIFESNDFQLVLSMAWHNIKEACFLLASLTSLLNSMLEFFVKHRKFVFYEQVVQKVLQWVTAKELNDIGKKLAGVLVRCRHKGVIEAAGRALTHFTKRILNIQQNIQNIQGFQYFITPYRTCLDQFVEHIVSIIDMKSTSSSITRRSAGLAYITQAVLCGESMARLDATSYAEPVTYSKIVQMLIMNALTPVQGDIVGEMLTDLPQSNALHILQSIVNTSELSQYTAKTVETLFSICVDGFFSPHWQIRNASLQLFGACISRMVGQKKRKKVADSELGNELGASISFEEFFSRYPKLVEVIYSTLHRSYDFAEREVDNSRPELVPLISLLSSFSRSTGFLRTQENEDFYRARVSMIDCLIAYLRYPIWKVRWLTSRALANFWSWTDFEAFVFEFEEAEEISTNFYHGVTEVAHEMIRIYGLSDNNTVMDIIKKIGRERKNLIECSFMTFYEEALDNHSFTEIDSLDMENVLQDQPQDTLPAELSLMSSPATEIEVVPSDGRSSGHYEGSNHSMASPLPPNLSPNIFSDIDRSIDFTQSDVVRLRSANQLCEIAAPWRLTDDPLVWLSICQIAARILEDEDREVRAVGFKIVAKLKDKQLFDQTTSIEAIIELMLEKTFQDVLAQEQNTDINFTSVVVEHFLRRMICASDMSYLRQLLSITEIYNNEDEFILFEKEKKNVYSEPYLMSMRMGSFLMMVSRRSMKPFSMILGESATVRHIAKLVTDFGVILDLLDGHQIEKFVMLSIWKLPSFVNALVNLLFLLKLSVANRPNLSYCEIIQRIETQFSFLSTVGRLVLRERAYEEIPLRAALPTPLYVE